MKYRKKWHAIRFQSTIMTVYQMVYDMVDLIVIFIICWFLAPRDKIWIINNNWHLFWIYQTVFLPEGHCPKGKHPPNQRMHHNSLVEPNLLMNALELLTSRCMRTEPAKIVTPIHNTEFFTIILYTLSFTFILLCYWCVWWWLWVRWWCYWEWEWVRSCSGAPACVRVLPPW